MKRFFAMICILTLLCSLISCDPGHRSLDEGKTKQNTVKIELVHYENNNPKHVRLRWKEPKFDFDKVTLLATLDESKFDSILNDIGSRSFISYSSRALNEPLGKAIILYQSNGDMIVLFACDYTNEKGKTLYYGNCLIFDRNGDFLEYKGEISTSDIELWESKYFSTETALQPK